jgi:hypothetical protein
MHAEFADDSNPTQVDYCLAFGTVRWGSPGSNTCPDCGPIMGACCFPDGHCEFLDQSACPGQYMGDGTTCDPNPCEQVEACCLADGSCVMVTPNVCLDEGGVPQGSGTECYPDPCITHFEACCLPDGHCEETIFGSGQCAQEGGISQGIDTRCDPNPCPPAQACCFSDNHCEMLTADACTAGGGTPQGEGTTCDSIQCVPTPSKPTTWGRIKATYR